MKKVSIAIIMLLIVLASSPVNAATSLTSTASVSFYDSHPTGKFTATGAPIPSVQFINYQATSITKYKVLTWHDWPIINLFMSHDCHRDFYGMKFKTLDGCMHQVKLAPSEANQYLHVNNYPVNLVWRKHTLFFNNYKTTALPLKIS